jgi:hypothetical protein
VEGKFGKPGLDPVGCGLESADCGVSCRGIAAEARVAVLAGEGRHAGFYLISEGATKLRGWNLPGIFPRAFSDIPRICVGTASSTLEDTEPAREGCSVGVDTAGVGHSSSVSSSSSSPIAKVPSSSGTSLSAGARAETGLLRLSADPLRLSLKSPKSLGRSFRRLARRSSSSWPLSRVNDRNAAKSLDSNC